MTTYVLSCVDNSGSVKAGRSGRRSRCQSRSRGSVERCRQLCAVCGRQFVDAAAFDRHTACHAAPRLHLCSVCGVVMATAGALYRHRAVHVPADRRPLACAHCDRRFVRPADLRKHVRAVHADYRPYRCSLCARTFARSYSLLAHGRTHAARSALRPCRACRRTFKSAAGLAVHRRFLSLIHI